MLLLVGVGAPPAGVGVAVLGPEPDGLGEVGDGLAVLLGLEVGISPAGVRIAVLRVAKGYIYYYSRLCNGLLDGYRIYHQSPGMGAR